MRGRTAHRSRGACVNGCNVVESTVAEGGVAHFIKTDISKSEQVRAMIDEIIEVYGRLDCVVNNAPRTASP